MRTKLLAALAGLLTAAVAGGAGELVAGIVPGAKSLIVSVGDAVIDLAPSPVKEFAIDVFGTNDKIALVIGICILLALLGAVVGIIARRTFWLGAAGIVCFGALGLAAALANTAAPLLPTVAPSVVATLVGIGALYLLVRALDSERNTTKEAREGAGDLDRRAFLRTSGVLATAALAAGGVGRWLQAQASAAAERAQVMLGAPADPLPPIPAGADLGIDGVAPWQTPNADFYRIDTALQVPQIDVDSWVMRITGMVDNPMELTFDDLRNRRLVEADITLTCVSNEVGGDLISNGRWLGVPLAELLDEAGVAGGATQLVGRSVDGYTCGFPVEDALDGRQALVAIGLNGEPLPLEHGYPARLIVPGLYGYVSATKWLSEIELTTFQAFDHYWVERGWAVKAPIKTQSRIDTPRPFAELPAGRVAVAGVAWAQTRGIEKVEVQVDDGDWTQARLAEAVNDVTWRQWVFEWDARESGQHRLRVRATDSSGETQTEERVAPIPDGASGWHQVLVTVSDGTPA